MVRPASSALRWPVLPRVFLSHAMPHTVMRRTFWATAPSCRVDRYIRGRPLLPHFRRFQVTAQGYDDGFGSTQLWRSIGNITASLEHARRHGVSLAVRTDRARAVDTPLAAAAEPKAPRKAGAAPARRVYDEAAMPAAAAAAVAAANVTTAPTGSCSCRCPPAMGFGVCFNLRGPTSPDAPCGSVLQYAGDVCPAHGQPRQCRGSPYDEDCAAVTLGGGTKCTLATGCQELPGAGTHGLPAAQEGLKFATCLCRPVAFPESYCQWSDQPCDYSPFFPPSPINP